MIITPEEWGPHAVATMYVYIMGYDVTQRDSMKAWLVSHKDILPCSECRNHWKEWIEKERPLTDEILSSREALLQWFIDWHVTTRSRAKKISKPLLNAEDVVNVVLSPMYERQKNPSVAAVADSVADTKYYYLIFIVAVVSIICYFRFR